MQLVLSLAHLGGLVYEIKTTRAGASPIRASTNIDWFEGTIDGTSPTYSADLREAADAAIASGANPLGFGAKQLDRTSYRNNYAEAGLLGLPDGDPLRFWYSDGGALDNKPFGRAIDAVRSVEARAAQQGRELDGDRIYVFVEPSPPGAPSGPWLDADRTPSWTSTLVRVLVDLRNSQAVYSDLRRLERRNSQVLWTERTADRLLAAFDTLLDGVPNRSPRGR